MQLSRLATASLVVGILIASLAGARAAPRALLQLFTSQGCSSCPPADKLLGAFAKDPSLVALSLPINIWDYLGWKDTLALPRHSALQRAYARMRGDWEIYTPQIVVNGLRHVLGSDRPAIERVIAETDRNPAVMSVSVMLSARDGELIVTVKAPAGSAGKAGVVAAAAAAAAAAPVDAKVWLCPVARAISVAIGRGENRGRTVTYHNVVRGWRLLGDWTGTDATWHIPISKIETGRVDAAAVMVQEGTRKRPGLILGAAFAPLGQETAATAAPVAGRPPAKRH